MPNPSVSPCAPDSAGIPNRLNYGRQHYVFSPSPNDDVRRTGVIMDGRWVAYLRVSTERQGKSGLGIEAQRAAVNAFLNGGAWSLLSEFVEVESGKRNDRPMLAEALQACRMTGATLLIAKLDRLSRDAHFLIGLQRAGVAFRACDMPEADGFVVGIMAMVAQREREMISARTKAALAVAKARGVKMGGFRGHVPDAALATEARRRSAAEYADTVGPTIEAAHAEGLSLRQIAARMIERGIKTPKGGAWTAASVRAVLLRRQGSGAASPPTVAKMSQ